MQRQVFLLLTVLIPNTGLAGTRQAVESEITSKIDSYAAPFAEAGHLSGTLLVARGNEVLYERSWGLSDRQRDVPFLVDTPSCVASVTKPTTVILAAQLIDSGTIALSDPISRWLKNFPKGDQIQFQSTLR